ncbi:MAG: hypothetical protein AAFX76_10785 [Planctomycetota bacterium]
MPTDPPFRNARRVALPAVALAALGVSLWLTADRVDANVRQPVLIQSMNDRQLEDVIRDAIEPLTLAQTVPVGWSAVVPDPRGGAAVLVTPDGLTHRLGFRLDRMAPATPLAPDAYAVVRDTRDQLFVVHPDGSYREILDN